MITVRKSEDRGHANHGWLDTYHTFSFASYQDPDHVKFRALRVINEDKVAGGQGFGKHPHRDMEILTYVLEGALEHQDSMGSREVLRPGEVQFMGAGTGIMHSEYNASKTDPVHLMQIWLLPERAGLPPAYEQKEFPIGERSGRLALVASGRHSESAADGSRSSGGTATLTRTAPLKIRTNVDLYASTLSAGEEVEHTLAPGRHAWIQVARGSLNVNGIALVAGDGASVSEESVLRIATDDSAEFLLFDLA